MHAFREMFEPSKYENKAAMSKSSSVVDRSGSEITGAMASLAAKFANDLLVQGAVVLGCCRGQRS